MLNAFTWCTAFFAAVWLVIFFFRKDLRKEMLIVSVTAFFLTPVIMTAAGGNATLVAARFAGLRGVDVLFAFTTAGIAASIFHAVFGVHYHRLPLLSAKKTQEGVYVQLWLLRLFITTVLFLWGMIFGTLALHMTPAESALAAGIVLALYVLLHRRDLVMDAVASALLMGVVAYMSGAVALFLTTEDFTSLLLVTDNRIGNVPTDLVLWSVAFGLALGPLYEYVRHFGTDAQE